MATGKRASAQTPTAPTKQDSAPRKKGPGLSFTGYSAWPIVGSVRQMLVDWLTEQGVSVPAYLKGEGGSTITLGRLVLDGSGQGSGHTVEQDGRTITVGAGAGEVAVGLILYQNRFVRVYPLVGAGGMGGGTGEPPRLDDASANAPEVPADESEGDAPRSKTDTPMWFMILLHAGLGIDLTLPLWVFKLVIGVRVGLQSDPISVQIGGGQAATGCSGPFFRVITGLRFGR